jgi:hypothetical protein
MLFRLRLVTPAMHAYAHEWECQLYYSTRLQIGMGLTDGEGNERLWARNRSLIPITRSSAVSNLTMNFLKLPLRDVSAEQTYLDIGQKGG